MSDTVGSMDLIRRVLFYPQCEVFTYLNYKDMNRWIIDDARGGIHARFWRRRMAEARDLPEKQRRDLLLGKYKQALKDRAGAKYVRLFFDVRQEQHPALLALVLYEQPRGLEEMKKAMWYVDKDASFDFGRDDPAKFSY